MKTHICNTCAVLLALLGSVTVTTAVAADQEICLRYPVETVDSGLGETVEDHYALNDQLWPYWKVSLRQGCMNCAEAFWYRWIVGAKRAGRAVDEMQRTIRTR